MDFNLNRYQNNINFDTPHDVIISLVACCGKKITRKNIEEHFEDIVKFLKNYNYILPPQKEYYSQDDYIKIANYVSSGEQEWQPTNLIRAMNHIKDFNEKLELTLPISIGNKNNNNIFSYDIIMLYEYCYSRNISTTTDDTIDTLLKKIEIKQEEDSYNDRDCVEIIQDNVEDCERSELLTILRMLKSRDRKERKEKKIEKEEIEVSPPEPLRSVEEIKNSININYMISRSKLDENEALVYSAKFLALNLSHSDNKVKELLEYNRCHMKDETYTPTGDDLFSRNYKLNKYYYRLDHFWHPEIADLYTQKNITLLLKNEGLGSEEGKHELDIGLCNDNFYFGIIPGFEKLTTYFDKLNLEDINNNHILFYGNRQEEKYEVFSVQEIIKHFKENNCLKEFKKDSIISPNAIKKLKAISKMFNNDTYYSNLLDLINEIKDNEIKNNIVEEVEIKEEEEDNNVLDEFKNKYLFASDQVDRFLEEVFFFSMYSRGWKIKDLLDYPLNESESADFDKNIKNIGDNIKISYRRIKTIIDRIADKSISKMIYLLPLMKYNKEEKTFSKQSGLTLFEKVKIIPDENDDYDYLSVRNDSYVIALTAYYYIFTLSGKKMFNIDKLN